MVSSNECKQYSLYLWYAQLFGYCHLSWLEALHASHHMVVHWSLLHDLLQQCDHESLAVHLDLQHMPLCNLSVRFELIEGCFWCKSSVNH